MKNKYKFAILGAGNGGMAFAGHISSRGHDVSLFEGIKPSEAFLRLSEEKEIYLEGDMEARGKLKCVTTDMEEALTDADVILVVVPSFAHEPLFNKLIPLLKDGDKIILVPGNYGTFLFKKMMSEKGVSKKISISESASLPYACRATKYNTVMIHKLKKVLKIATHPVRINDEIIDIMNPILNMFIPAENVLEASMDNFNCILHPLPALLNIGVIEKNSNTFRHYIDGISPIISEKMSQMDDERLSIGNKYSINLMSTLNQLKMYYGENDSKDIYEYVNSDQSPYKNIIGHSTHSRYITEDTPYLLIPGLLLGEKVGIKASLYELCIKLASKLHNKDYIEYGYNLERLGIANMSTDHLLNYIA